MTNRHMINSLVGRFFFCELRRAIGNGAVGCACFRTDETDGDSANGWGHFPDTRSLNRCWWAILNIVNVGWTGGDACQPRIHHISRDCPLPAQASGIGIESQFRYQ